MIQNIFFPQVIKSEDEGESVNRERWKDYGWKNKNLMKDVKYSLEKVYKDSQS